MITASNLFLIINIPEILLHCIIAVHGIIGKQAFAVRCFRCQLLRYEKKLMTNLCFYKLQYRRVDNQCRDIPKYHYRMLRELSLLHLIFFQGKFKT